MDKEEGRVVFCSFNKSHSFLDSINVKRLDDYKSNVSKISKIDLTEAESNGDISWNEDGVYLNFKNEELRGFMYHKKPDINSYGLPKFHLYECTTIDSQKRGGRFDNNYYWSNSPKVTVTDRVTKKDHHNTILKLCNNCKNILLENALESMEDTSSFGEILEENNRKIEDGILYEKTDIFNRPFNFRQISRKYREKMNYTCEECGFGGDDLKSNYDKRFLEVHHIKSNQLKNTHTNNLKCLCILCHSKQDQHHIENFNKPAVKRKLKQFISIYYKTLEELRNKYI